MEAKWRQGGRWPPTACHQAEGIDIHKAGACLLVEVYTCGVWQVVGEEGQEGQVVGEEGQMSRLAGDEGQVGKLGGPQSMHGRHRPYGCLYTAEI